MSTQESFTARIRRELSERYAPAESAVQAERTPEQLRAERENAQLRAQIEKARARNRWVVGAW